MTKTLWPGLILIFIFQLIISANFELAHDEAYYWLFSRHLDWGYFDHPPFMAVLIRCFSFLGNSELAVRFGFILLQFLTLGVLLKLSDKKHWGLITLLYFSFPIVSIGGMFALPDMPLLFMSACYFLALKIFLDKSDFARSLLLASVIALLLYAKYHGILLIFFTILAIPKLLIKKEFYVVAVVSLLMFLPHMIWQYRHDFVTLNYHFFQRPSASFSVKRMIEYIGTQIFLAGLLMGPIIWWITLKFKSQSSFQRVLKFVAIGVVAFFLISSFTKRVEANWTIFLVIPLILIACTSEIIDKIFFKRVLVFTFIITLSARVLLVMSPEKISLKRLKEFHGWRAWSGEVEKKCLNKELVANSYQIASKLSFYLDKEIHSLNFRSRNNQFDLWRLYDQYSGGGVCYITDKSEFSGDPIKTPEDKGLKIALIELKELLNKK